MANRDLTPEEEQLEKKSSAMKAARERAQFIDKIAEQMQRDMTQQFLAIMNAGKIKLPPEIVAMMSTSFRVNARIFVTLDMKWQQGFKELQDGVEATLAGPEEADASPPKFATGDVVTHGSGPKMTVREYTDEGMVACDFFDDNRELQQEMFHPSLLVRVSASSAEPSPGQQPQTQPQ